MKNGWIKVAAGTPRVQIADPAYNAEQIAASMQQAEKAGVQLLAGDTVGKSAQISGRIDRVQFRS